jgi:hypothetical protein
LYTAENSVDRTPSIREFDLNLTDVEDNVNGFNAFLASEFVHSGDAIEAVVLHRQLHDVGDIINSNHRIAVSLMECGTKILVEEPAVPGFFHTHVDSILSGIDHPETQRAIQTAHLSQMNSILADPDRGMKRYILKLPPGVKCKMGYTNPSSGRGLLGSMNVSEKMVPVVRDMGVIENVVFSMVTITYVIALDKDEHKIVQKNPALGNEAADYFNRRAKRF